MHENPCLKHLWSILLRWAKWKYVTWMTSLSMRQAERIISHPRRLSTFQLIDWFLRPTNPLPAATLPRSRIGVDFYFCPWVPTLGKYSRWWLWQNDIHCTSFRRPSELLSGAIAAGSSMTHAVCVNGAAAARGISQGRGIALTDFTYGSSSWFLNHKCVSQTALN